MSTENLIQNLSSEVDHIKPISSKKSFLLYIGISFLTLIISFLFLGIRSNDIPLFQTISLGLIFLISSHLAYSLSIPGKKSHPVYEISLGILLSINIIYLGYHFLNEIIDKNINAFTFYTNQNFTCFTCVVLISIIPILYLVYSLSKLAPTLPKLVGFLSAISASSLGAIGVMIHCGLDQPFHHLISTLLPMILIIYGGGFLGKKFLKW